MITLDDKTHDVFANGASPPDCQWDNHLDWDCLYQYSVGSQSTNAADLAAAQAEQTKIRAECDISIALGLVGVGSALCSSIAGPFRHATAPVRIPLAGPPPAGPGPMPPPAIPGAIPPPPGPGLRPPSGQQPPPPPEPGKPPRA